MMRTLALPLIALLSCQPGTDGASGGEGAQGPPGPMGAAGKDGAGVVPAALGRSGGRLKYIADVFLFEDGAASGGTRVLWDTKLQVPCRALRAEDGALRCLPSERSGLDGIQYGFADDKCSRQLLGLPVGMTLKYTMDSKPGAKGYSVYGLGAKIAAPAKLYQNYNAPLGCTSLPGDVPRPGLDWHEAHGTAIPPADFVAAEQKTLIE